MLLASEAECSKNVKFVRLVGVLHSERISDSDYLSLKSIENYSKLTWDFIVASQTVIHLKHYYIIVVFVELDLSVAAATIHRFQRNGCFLIKMKISICCMKGQFLTNSIFSSQ